MLVYLSKLTLSKAILWCYLIWYLVTVYFYFDASPWIWLNSLGISAIIGIALLISVGAGASWRENKWQTFRLFLMPFCVSSFSSLIKGKGYFLVIPPDIVVLGFSVFLCVLFVVGIWVLKSSKVGINT